MTFESRRCTADKCPELRLVVERSTNHAFPFLCSMSHHLLEQISIRIHSRIRLCKSINCIE